MDRLVKKWGKMSLRKKISLALSGSVVLSGFLILGWAILTGRLGGKAIVENLISDVATVTYKDESGKSYGPSSSNTVYTTKIPLLQWALKIALQGAKTFATSATITVSQTGTTTVVATVTVTSDANGNITIDPTGVKNITPGLTYDIRIKVNGYLIRKITTTLPPATTVDVGKLLVGDYNGDNKVDLLDFGTWVYVYRKTVPATDRRDINQDGIVDLLDFGTWVINYKKVGD